MTKQKEPDLFSWSPPRSDIEGSSAVIIGFPIQRRIAEIEDEKRAAEIEKLARRFNQYDAKRARLFLQGYGQKLFNRLTARGMSDDEASDMADVLEEAVWNRILEIRRHGYVDEGA
jgi:hypothetical protein